MSLSHCTIVKCEIRFSASHWSMGSLRASTVTVWINSQLSPVRCSQLNLTQLPIDCDSLYTLVKFCKKFDERNVIQSTFVLMCLSWEQSCKKCWTAPRAQVWNLKIPKEQLFKRQKNATQVCFFFLCKSLFIFTKSFVTLGQSLCILTHGCLCLAKQNCANKCKMQKIA